MSSNSQLDVYNGFVSNPSLHFLPNSFVGISKAILIPMGSPFGVTFRAMTVHRCGFIFYYDGSLFVQHKKPHFIGYLLQRLDDQREDEGILPSQRKQKGSSQEDGKEWMGMGDN
jgi:hypothetical protein